MAEHTLSILWDVIDEETGEIILDAEEAFVTVSVSDYGSPRVTSGHPDNWEPAEGPDFIILSVKLSEKTLTDIDHNELRGTTILSIISAIEEAQKTEDDYFEWKEDLERFGQDDYL